jgi:predicted NUDIX family phosphoesterase
VSEERVLCLPRQALESWPEWPALTAGPGALFAPARALQLASFDEALFLPRSRAESDPAYKQLIPYIVVRRGRDDVFVYERATLGGEARLHHRTSVGVGGHINDQDFNGDLDSGWSKAERFFLGLARSVRRELDEELEIEGLGNQAPRLVGFVNDESNSVGQVHLGLVYELVLPQNASVECRDPGLRAVGFRAPQGLPREAFETWSQVVLDHLEARRDSRK